MKKIIPILLSVCVLLSALSMVAYADASPLAGDVNGDGKVTPFDALQVQSHLHGQMTLTQAQIARAIAAAPAITELSSAHIVAIFNKPLSDDYAQAPESDGLYHIASVSDLALLRSFPYAGFSLDADLNMSGVAWAPFVFNGVLLGNGHTISNLNVTAGSNNLNAGGLFLKLGGANNRTARVENLTLANPTLTTGTQNKYAGLICGANYGTITGVNITDGLITGTINTTDNAVGIEAGKNYGTVAVGSETLAFDINVASCTTTETGLVGQNAAGAAVSVDHHANITFGDTIVSQCYSFNSNAVSGQAVVDYMENMATIEWKNTFGDVTYGDSSSVKPYKVSANAEYFGMKYGHEAASYDAILSQLEYNDSTGKYETKYSYESYYNSEGIVPDYSITIPAGKIIMGHYFSNDCSSSIAWAMAQVSGTMLAERTSHMVPNATNVAKFGMVKVGNYALTCKNNDSNYENYTSWWDTDATTGNKVTRSILTDADGNVDLDKLNALYESYALLQPGDGVVEGECYWNTDANKEKTDGHAKLVVDVNIVPYSSGENAGKIDPDASTITTIECGGAQYPKDTGNNDAYKGKSNHQWHKNTAPFWYYAGFTSKESATGYYPTIDLYTGPYFDASKRYKVYVPFTCRELASGYRPEAYVQLNNSNSPLNGVIVSNYRIDWTSVTIDGVEDKSFTGTEKWGTSYNNQYEGIDESLWIANNGDTYGYTSYLTLRKINTSSTEASRMIYKSVNLAKHADAFAGLASGTHDYTITVKLGTGETATFSGTFTN